MIRVLSVTMGDMLQQPAANRQMWNGLIIGPRYGDLSVKIKKDPKRVDSMCFAAQGNETPEAGPAGIRPKTSGGSGRSRHCCRVQVSTRL